MKQIRWLLVLLAGVLIPCAAAFAYDSLEQLLDDQQRKQLDALKEYVAAHPDAEDRADAEDRLAYGYVMTSQYDEALALLLKKYDDAAKDLSALSMEQLFGTLVAPLVQTYVQAGKINEGKDFVARVRKDLGDKAQSEDVAAALDQLAESLKLPSVGEGVEIKFTALDGTEIDVAKMTDKVVLVDFWATWCMPCMQEMPRVKAIYEKYHTNGFEIVGISLDEDKDALQKTIKDRNLAWPQAFDGEAWDTALAKKYGVQSIPTTFLLGKDGKIAALNLRGDALDKKVAELLGEGAKAE